jgi:hypothetical protein
LEKLLIVPVLSSSVHGPLGVKHLPRLWLKVRLYDCGRLPEGYRRGIGGFDEFLTTTLGLDRDAFIAYIRDEKPTYLALEAWVRAIAAVNTQIERTDLPEAMRAERAARIGFFDPSYVNAVSLNDLDDWTSMHEALLAAD